MKLKTKRSPILLEYPFTPRNVFGSPIVYRITILEQLKLNKFVLVPGAVYFHVN